MEKIKRFGISLLISFIMVIVLILISALIFAYTNIDDRHMQTFVFASVMLSVLIGSTILAKKIKEKGLIFGIAFGILFCLIIYLITSIAFTGFFISNTLWLYLGISAISGVIGGVIGVNI